MDQKIIKFEDVKDDLVVAINSKLPKLHLTNITLLEGFINQSISMKLSNSLVIGGPTIPMIAVIENDTGRLHFFAVKALLPTFGQ